MVIFEPSQAIEVDTPRGRGRIWLVTEYGSEIEKSSAMMEYQELEKWNFPILAKPCAILLKKIFLS